MLSTGKSSNSSSSSNAAAGFVSFEESGLFSELVALVVGAAPDAGAADMTVECVDCVQQRLRIRQPRIWSLRLRVCCGRGLRMRLMLACPSWRTNKRGALGRSYAELIEALTLPPVRLRPLQMTIVAWVQYLALCLPLFSSSMAFAVLFCFYIRSLID